MHITIDRLPYHLLWAFLWSPSVRERQAQRQTGWQGRSKWCCHWSPSCEGTTSHMHWNNCK